MHNFKRTVSKTSLATFTLVTATMAMAHPNHMMTATFGEALQSGLMHPFTGTDHMMLAVGMGMLMYRYRRSALGVGSLIVGLMAGFGLAVTGLLTTGLENRVEYGILTSLLVVAVSLFSKKFAPTTGLACGSLAILALFHGMAHGLEVPDTMQAEGFLTGMLMSMTALFALGTAVMAGIKHYFGNSIWLQRGLAGLGLVAVVLG